MTRFIPYKATTSSGNEYEFQFRLHPHTESSVDVANLLGCVLDAVARELDVLGKVSNGDVLQALAMAIATRAAVIEGKPEVIRQLVNDLVQTALTSTTTPGPANVPADDKKPLH